MAVKFNPFRPNNMVGPGMFVGRVDELETIEKCLVQTKHGNPQHFLVQGERGIGKSSLLGFVEAMGTGDAFIDDPKEFGFLVVSVDIGGCDTQLDIIRTIARGLRRSLNEQKKIVAAAKDFWEWLTNWEVLGVKFNKGGESIDTEEVTDELVDQLSDFCSSSTEEIDGILLLIDEADRPRSEAGIGEF